MISLVNGTLERFNGSVKTRLKQRVIVEFGEQLARGRLHRASR